MVMGFYSNVSMMFIKIQCNLVLLIVGFNGIRTSVTISTYRTSAQKWIEM